MVFLPFQDRDLVDEVNAFANLITPDKERWLYCLSRVMHEGEWRGQPHTSFDERAAKVCERIIGKRCKNSFRPLLNKGWDQAIADDAEQRERLKLTIIPPRYSVGPLQPWLVGHVYFARVNSHPHVLKIGFSRRVRDRLQDVESKCKTSLHVPAGQLQVGTLADEHWWHLENKANHISGEWFFDPKSTNRTVPAFLETPKEEAA